MNNKIFNIYVVESLFQPNTDSPGQVIFACDSWESVIDRLGRLGKQMGVKDGDWDVVQNRGMYYAQMWTPYDQTYMFRISETRLYTIL